MIQHDSPVLSQELVGHGTRPQLILRAGYPAQAAAETPRIPWQQTLDSRH